MTARDEDLQRLARRRVGLKMGWLIHALVYVLVNLGLAAISLYQGRQWYLGPLLGWGLGLAIHGIVVWVNLRGQGLREHLMQAELEKLRRQPPR